MGEITKAIIDLAGLVAALATLFVAIKGLFKVEEVRKDVNSKMSEFLEVSGKAKHAEGMLAGAEKAEGKVMGSALKEAIDEVSDKADAIPEKTAEKVVEAIDEQEKREDKS